ncbi:hypothetical protein MMC17_008825 [Xylographa soralifera]|nr:hypothetical protein [Xylographa soralifera]
MPITSFTRICNVETEPGIDLKQAFRLQLSLVDVQMITARTAELPFAIKEGQLATRDIEMAIAISDIPGRADISHHLNDFVELAQSTIFELMRYHANCSISVDFALSLNYRAKRSLQDVETKRVSPISRSWNTAIALIPWGGEMTIDSVRRIYFQYTKELHSELASLIAQGERLSRDLLTLETELYAALGILGREKDATSSKMKGLETFRAMISHLHRTQLQAVKDQLGFMPGLISNIKNAREGTTDTTDKLRSINVAMASLHKVLARPGAQLILNHADVGYYLNETDIVIASLEKGRKKLVSHSQKYGKLA